MYDFCSQQRHKYAAQGNEQMKRVRKVSREAEQLIYLAACAVNQISPDHELVSRMDVEAVLKFASHHQMTALAAAAMKAGGLTDSILDRKLEKAKLINLMFDADRADILRELEKKQIWYMTLKGTVLKQYYPQAWMRQMSDNDILFDATRAEDVRMIMESLGYTTEIFDSEHRDDYERPPLSHFEMHRMLFSSTADERLYRYFRNFREHLRGDGLIRHLSDEDFYIYMISHEFSHYNWCGTGLRSLLDTYVYLKEFADTLDWQYIGDEMRSIGIADFEEKNRLLAQKAYADGRPEKLTREEAGMLSYFATSGAYGTSEHNIENQIKAVGRYRYLLRRTFISMEGIKNTFPFFYRHKILLPLLPFYRIYRSWENAKEEILALLRR